MKWFFAATGSLVMNGLFLYAMEGLRFLEKPPVSMPVHLVVHLLVSDAPPPFANTLVQADNLPVEKLAIEPPIEPAVTILTTPNPALRAVPLTPPVVKKIAVTQKPVVKKPDVTKVKKDAKKVTPPVQAVAKPAFKKAAPIPPVAHNPKLATVSNVSPTAGVTSQPSGNIGTGGTAATAKKAHAGNEEVPLVETPLVRIEPIYPRMARNQGITGSVVVEFTITATGEVENIQIIKADPEDIFEEATEQALTQWQFEPRTTARRARQTIRFNLKNGD